MRKKLRIAVYTFAVALMLLPSIIAPQSARAVVAQNGYFTQGNNYGSLQYGVVGSKPTTILSLASGQISGILSSNAGDRAAFLTLADGNLKPTAIKIVNKDGSGLIDITPAGLILPSTTYIDIIGWSQDDTKLLVFAYPDQSPVWINVAQKQLSNTLPLSVNSVSYLGDYSGKVYYIYNNGLDTSGNPYGSVCNVNEDGTNAQCFVQFNPAGWNSSKGQMLYSGMALSRDGKWAAISYGEQSDQNRDVMLVSIDGTNRQIPLNLRSRLTEFSSFWGERGSASFMSDGSLFISAQQITSGTINFVLGSDYQNIKLSKPPVANIVHWAPQTSATYYPDGYFTAVTPARIADTRTGSGYPNAGSHIPAGNWIDVKVTGVGGVPATGVSSVVVNVTAVNATAGTYLTAFRKGDALPPASSLNVSAGQIVNNQLTVQASSDGYISLYNGGGTIDAIVDVVGYNSANGSSYKAQDAQRVLDTRTAGVKVPAGGSVDVQVGSSAAITACQIKNDAVTAASIQLTVTNQTVNGFLSVFPAGSSAQGASSLNFYSGQTITRMVTSALGNRACDGSNGKLTIKNNGSAPVDVIADLIGVYTTDRSHGVYMPITPERLFDSRYGTGTFVGRLGTQSARFVAMSQQTFGPSGAASVARALDTNMIVVGASAPTYLTASTSATFSPSQTYVTYNSWNPATNRGTVKVNGSTGFNIFNAIGTTDAIVDQFGYYY